MKNSIFILQIYLGMFWGSFNFLFKKWDAVFHTEHYKKRKKLILISQGFIRTLTDLHLWKIKT